MTSKPKTVLRFVKDPYATGRFEMVDLELPAALERELYTLSAEKAISIYYLAAIYAEGRADASAAPPPVDPVCHWRYEDCWVSECGLHWEMLNDEPPTKNQMAYCPQCGRVLQEIEQ